MSDVPDRGPATSAVTIIFIVLATVFVAARFYTRTFIVRSIKQDDWWILGAWLLAVGVSASICAGVAFGLGKHKRDIPDDDLGALRKAQYAFSILYNPCLMLTKTSIIVFFLSVMSKDVDAVFKWCNWITLAVVNAVGLALTFYNVFQCTNPVSAGYRYPTPESAHCANIVTLYLSSAPVNIITDIAILFLPMPILTGLRLPKKQKIILIVTFSIFAFVAIIDVVRLAYLQNAAAARLRVVETSSGTLQTVRDDNDLSWDASLSFMWSAVEVNLGILCACVPSLKPLFLKFLPQVVKDDNSPGGTQDGPDLQPAGLSEAIKGNVSMLNHPAAFRKPLVKEYAGEDEGDNMGFLNMLAGPEEDAPELGGLFTRRLTRTRTNKSTASDFDFVKTSGNKNMLKLSNRESVWPIAVVSLIFFLWGIAYGFLNTLNAQFQKVTGVGTAQGLGLHGAYFGGYAVGPLTLGRFVLKRYGFKATMMAGLSVYGCGALVFWPSAVLTSYGAFIVSNFIVAFGLSLLEVAANPYIAICGPMEYAEVRLNFSQAFQAVGTVCSRLLASKVLFGNITTASSLVDVQWAYLGIALFVYGLAVVFYYIPLPEATDDQLEEQADRRSAAYRARIGPWRVVFVTLGLGVFTQFGYVGLQESFGGNFEGLVRATVPNSDIAPANLQTVGLTVFAVGRFLAAFLNYVLKPRWILLTLYIGLIVCLALLIALDGTASVGIQMMVYFFEAGIFSIIYAICMRGLGAHLKTGSAFMASAISGGAVFSPIQWAVLKGHGVKYSYSVPLAVAVTGLVFAFYLNLVPAARNQVDPTHENRSARRERRALKRLTSGASVDSTAQKFGLAGIIARRKKHKLEGPTSEHVERTPTEQSIFSPTQEKEEAIVQMSVPQGLVGSLKPWRHGDDPDAIEVGESSSTRHRPVWDGNDEDDDSIFDDYHTIMRRDMKKR
jgi:fucose permease